MDAGGEKTPRVSDELLKMMVCPVAHTPMVRVDDWLYSTDPETRRKYPIRDGIPIMLVEESQMADPEEFERAISQGRKPRDTLSDETN